MNFDPNYYYRLSTKFRGKKMNMDIYNGGNMNNMPHLTDQKNFTGQYWSIKPSNKPGYYSLSTMFRGAHMHLDVYNGGKYNNMLHLVPAANYSGQYWKIEQSTSQPAYFHLSTMFRGDKIHLDIFNGGAYNNMPHLASAAHYSGQYWAIEKTNQQVYTSDFANLAPPKDFMASFESINKMSASIQDFNENLDMKTRINSLTGKALTIATEIRDVLTPKLQRIGSEVSNSIKTAEQQTEVFGENMIDVCNELKKPQVEAALLTAMLKMTLTQAKSVDKTVKGTITPSLDSYHQQLNALISKLGSEKIAIKDNNDSLKHQRTEIIDKMKARTHTVCGVVKTIWDTVTFQLQDQLQKDEEALARIQFQYNANSIAMGAAANVIGTVKNFESELENQTRFWDNFSGLLESLSSDVQGLITAHDSDYDSLYVDMVEGDWKAIKNAK